MPIEYTANATAGISTLSTSFGSIGTLFGIALLMAVIIGAVGFCLNTTWFNRLKKLSDMAGRSVKRTCIGGILCGVGYGIYWIGENLGGVASAVPVEYYLYAAGGYAGLNIIGYAAEKIWLKGKEIRKGKKA